MANRYNDTLGNTIENEKALADITASSDEKLKAAAKTAQQTGTQIATIGTSSRAAALGMKALSMAGNILLSMGISMAISWIASKVMDWVHADEKAIEKSEELTRKLKEQKDTVESNKNTIKEIKDDYERLSKGVDSLGHNVSLSADEYERYNELSNKIADMFPSLVKGYTDEGNAIIYMTGGINDLNSALQEQNKLYKDSMMANQKDVFEGLEGSYNKWQSDYGFYLEETKNAINLLIFSSKMTSEEFSQYLDNLENSGYDYIQRIKEILGLNPMSDIDLTKLSPEQRNDAIRALQDFINHANNELDSAVANVRPILDVWLERQADYGDAENETKNLIKSTIDNLSSEYIASFGDDYEALYTDIQNNIIGKLKNNKALSEGFDTVFNLETKLNNNQCTVEEYNEALKSFYAQVVADKTISEGVKKTILLAVGFELTTDENGNNVYTSPVDSLIASVEKKFKDGVDKSGVKTLSLDDLKIASNLKVDDGTIVSWDKFLVLLDKAKQEMVEINNISNLETALKSLKVLSDTINDFGENGYVSIDNLKSIKEEFKDVDGIDDYIKKLSSAKITVKELNSILSELALTQIKERVLNGDLRGATEEQIDLLLREANVTNHSEVAHDLMNQKKAKSAIQTAINTKQTGKYIDNLESEADACGLTTNALAKMIIKMMQLGNTELDLSQQIEEINHLRTVTELAAIGTPTGAVTNVKDESQTKAYTNLGITPKEGKGKNKDGSNMVGYSYNGQWYNDWQEAYRDALADITTKQLGKTDITPEISPYSEKERKENAKKIADYQKDLVKKEKEFAKNMAEAWEKEYLERLKEDLDEHKRILDKYTQQLEFVDFGKELYSETDYTNQMDLLSDKFNILQEQGIALNDEFNRVANIIPKSADEAQELASRIGELGTQIRDNVKAVREASKEIDKVRFAAIMAVPENQLSNLEKELDLFDKRLAILKADDGITGKYTRAFAFSDFQPNIDDFSETVKKQKKENNELIRLEQEKQDTINKIVEDAARLQSEKNAQARAEERQKLQEDMEETRRDIQENINKINGSITAGVDKDVNTVNKGTSDIKSGIKAFGEDVVKDTQLIGDIIFEKVKENVDNIVDEVNDGVEQIKTSVQDAINELNKLSSANTGGGAFGFDNLVGANGLGSGKKVYNSNQEALNANSNLYSNLPSGQSKCVAFVEQVRANMGFAGTAKGDGRYHGSNESNSYLTYTGTNIDKIKKRIDKGTIIGVYSDPNGNVVTNRSIGHSLVVIDYNKSTGQMRVAHHIWDGKTDKILEEDYYLDEFVKKWGVQGFSFAHYANGTDENGHPGGKALTGEEGRELAVLPNGKIVMLGEHGAELVDMPIGTQVIPHKETEDIVKHTGNINGERIKKYASGTGNVKDELQKLGLGGTVNLLLRPQINSSELKKAGWDVDGDSIATVFTNTISNSDFDDLMPGNNKDTIAINFTPIIANPETGEYKGVLTEQELYDYAHDVISGTRTDDLNLQIGTIFKGKNAIDDAIKVAEKIHELQDSFYSNIRIGAFKEVLATGDKNAIINAANELINNGQTNDLFSAYEEFEKEIKDSIEQGFKEAYVNIENSNITDAEKYSELMKRYEQYYHEQGEASNTLGKSLQVLYEVYKTNQESFSQSDFDEIIENFYKLYDTANSIGEKAEEGLDKIQQTLDEMKDKKLEELSKAFEEEISKVERAVDKKVESLEESISRKNSYGTLLQNHFDLVNSITEEQHNISKELKASKAMAEWLNEETRQLLFNERDYLALSKELKDVLGEANGIREQWEKAIQTTTPEALDEVTKRYEQQYELALKKYEILKAELEVSKKQQQLNNVLAERNVRMFTDKGWIWVANTQDVINAQNELEDAKYAQWQAENNKSQTMELQANEMSIAKLNTNINELNSYVTKIRNVWDEIQKQMQEEVLGVSAVISAIALADNKELHNIVNNVGDALSDLYTMITGKRLSYEVDMATDYMAAIQSGNDEIGSFLYGVNNTTRNKKIDLGSYVGGTFDLSNLDGDIHINGKRINLDELGLSGNVLYTDNTYLKKDRNGNTIYPDSYKSLEYFTSKYGALTPIEEISDKVAKLPNDLVSKISEVTLNYDFEPFTKEIMSNLTNYANLLVEKPVSQDNSITFNGDISLHEVNNGDNVLKNIIQQAKQLQLTRG